MDAKGAAAFPGLIDSHVHPVFGDWTPRQRTTDFIESGLHGGVTTMISAGEVHLPGRPKDIVGLKALAIVAQRAFTQPPARGRQGPGRRADPRAGHEGGGLRGARGGRRQPRRRGGARLREDGRRRCADARLGPRARLRVDVPHRRAVDRRVQRHRGGCRARGAAGHRGPRQRRHDGPARRRHRGARRERHGDRDRPLRERPGGAPRRGSRPRGRGAGPRDPGQRRAVGHGRRAAGDPAYDGASRVPRRDRARDRRVPRDREHRPGAPARRPA